MIDFSDFAEEQGKLMNEFLVRIKALKVVFEVEVNAMAWALASKILAKELPRLMAVGSLDWAGKAKKTELAIPVIKDVKIPVPKLEPKVQEVINDHLKLDTELADKFSDYKILGPQPKVRADQYQELLAKKSGAWSRRDGKVTYTCLGPASPVSNGHAAFYLMRRADNGEEKRVKFASICSDWKHIP